MKRNRWKQIIIIIFYQRLSTIASRKNRPFQANAIIITLTSEQEQEQEKETKKWERRKEGGKSLETKKKKSRNRSVYVTLVFQPSFKLAHRARVENLPFPSRRRNQSEKRAPVSGATIFFPAAPMAFPGNRIPSRTISCDRENPEKDSTSRGEKILRSYCVVR